MMAAIEQARTTSSTAQKIKRGGWIFYVIAFGIVLPIVTLLFELGWAWCAQSFFDPVPTVMHALLIAVVPLANLMSLFLIRGRFSKYAGKIRFLNGLAIGVSGFYAFMFMPLMPIAGLALIWLIGLLPLAPILSFIAAIMCRRALPKPALSDPRGPITFTNLVARLNLANWGIFAAILLIIAIEIPATITDIGLRMATSTDSAEQLRGVRLLRQFGDQQRLLSYSHERRGNWRDMVSIILSINQKPVSVVQAREVYYRVSGQVYNDVEAGPGRRIAWFDDQNWFAFDLDQGGDVVGKRLSQLTLHSSTMDGSIDSDAAIAYLEWTFEFHNASTQLAEARAQISLPPGAVVSRVTLWIDGEEREAAFAGRSQAKAAYQSVVRRQRDPILVTTAGADTAAVQLYPVPQNGRMKARIGMTLPLILREANLAILKLPHFKQHNFTITPDFEHSIWVESEANMASQRAHLIFESGNAGAASLRGKLNNANMKAPQNNILVTRDSSMIASYSDKVREKPNALVVQTFVSETTLVDHLVLVIDGSASMADYADGLADAVANSPPETAISIIIAADESIELETTSTADSPQSIAKIAEKIREYDYEGGIDNTLALETAWSKAANLSNAAVLWVHGPQPVLCHSVENLRQNWRRRAKGPGLYDFAISSRVNRIAEALDGVTQFQSLPRISSVQDDLEYQMALWRGERKQLRAKRELLPAGEYSGNGHKTSDHLQRLWANEQINQLLADNNKEQVEQAIKIAASYQLVTPVSGAVVLETQQQYDENGLQPVAEGTVPTIPEPETWLLIISTLSIMGWLLYRRQQRVSDECLLA